MLKRLITVGLAVWLGLTCIHNFPVFNPTPVPADAPVTVAVSEPPQAVPAPTPEVVPAPAVAVPVPDQPSAPAPQKQPSDSVSRAGSPAVKPAPTAPTPSRASAVKPSSNMSAEMLALINSERAKQGLSALVLDSRLSNGAYLKSKDMGVNGYFNHTSPTYGSPFQMMKSLGISYRSAAENIARNQTVSRAHTAFMNSAGHRENILDASFRKVGLGFYQSGNNLYVTQWFTN